SPFRLLQAPEPWATQDGVPRRAAISAFGFGGNNAHLIVEEWQPLALRPAVTHTKTQRHKEEVVAPRPSPLPIAIVGIEATVGPYPTFAALTQALLDGHGGTTTTTIDINLTGLRFPPNDLKHTLPQQLLILEVARKLAANHADLAPERTAVYIGMGCDPEIARYSMRWRLDEWASRWAAEGKPVSPEWIAAAKAALIPGLEAAGVIGTMPNIPANRINAQLNYLGPSHTVSAEELSGLRALACAVDALQRGEIDAALVGAVDLSVEVVHQAAAAELLDAQQQTPGDAAVVLLLKRAADAHREGDDILAIMDGDQRPSPLAPRPSVYTLPALSRSFGHAHAASGLLQVAVAALCLHERVRLSANADGLLEPAEPWLAAGGRRVRVSVDALGGQASTVILQEAFSTQRRRDAEKIKREEKQEKPSFLKKLGFWAGALHVFSGADAATVAEALERNEESNTDPARLVIVVHGDATLEQQRATARAALARVAPRPSPLAPAQLALRPSPIAKGIYWSPAPMTSAVGFVFTPAAAAYQGMGRELLFALPSLGDQVLGKFPCLARTQDWLATVPRPVTGDPFQILQGCALLSQLHATLTQDWLSLKPDAVLGVSSGETNSMFATGAWHDMDAMFAEIDASGMYTREIAGEYRAAKRAWQDRDPGPIEWAGWRVLAPVAEVEAALAGEEFAYLTMINAPADCLVAGQAAACRRVVAKIGVHRCVENANEIIAHHPAVKSWEAEWRAIHHRETQPVAGVRFYSNARSGVYAPDRETVADALTDQATAGVDFRRVVEAAWHDGVRIFVEHGPRNVCSGWIRSILGERAHLAVALDRPQHGVEQLLDAVAQLVAAGVAVDYRALNDALAAPSPQPASTAPSTRTLSLPAHYPPVILPAPAPLRTSQPAAPREAIPMQPTIQRMAPPPPLPPVLAAAASQSPRNLPPISPTQPAPRPAPAPVQAAAPPPPPAASVAAPRINAPVSPSIAPAPTPRPEPIHAQMVEQLTTFHGKVSAAHQHFLAQQARAMELLAALYGGAATMPPSISLGPETATDAPLSDPGAQQPAVEAASTAPRTSALQSLRTETDSATQLAAEQQRVEPGMAGAGKAAPAVTDRANETPSAPPTSQSTIHHSQSTIPGAPPSPLAPRPSPVRQHRNRYPGPSLDRRQLEHVASGKISEVLGPIFAQQDDFVRQVRMPMPPLLLADRVLGIDAEAGAVGQKGVIWTETDIAPDAWYLHNGRMPVGVLIESGQADLLLVSYLGADFVNKGERVYRLLGCEVTFRAELPQVGETLQYEIHLDGYAQHGPVRIFFFHYDCFSGDRLIFSVREGQAGFFTDDELTHSNGVIWDARTAEIVQTPRLDAP
ncbi:MAG TPA: beta-ketoacyl synthase N-terminal-like domain-containing protein, partial [Caldilinea sp.]|nr:beta-ketoacyl synthase N-terminal-like domain-containing protein [Caldilinea sp.]